MVVTTTTSTTEATTTMSSGVKHHRLTAPAVMKTYKNSNNSNKNIISSKCDNATTGSSTTSTSTRTNSTPMLIVTTSTKTATTDDTTTTTMKTKNMHVSSSTPKPNGPNLLLRWLFFGGCQWQRSVGKHPIDSRKNMGSKKEITTLKNPATTRSFLQLARERRFDNIVTILTDESSSTSFNQASWLQVQQGSRSSVCECLHALCLYRPTPIAVKVVQDAIKSAYSHTHTHTVGVVTSPSVGTISTATTNCITDCGVVVNAALITDAHGRTPLHIAVACGCSFAVIELLLQDDNTEAAYMMDHSNRYPLHWACTCSHIATIAKTNSSSRGREVDNTVKIINRLLEIYAMAVIAKDDLGCTPWDIAKSVSADPRIINALQFVKNLLPVKKRIKSHPDEATVITGIMTKNPIREAICIYNNNNAHDHSFMDGDDVSSIGSRGVSKAPRRRRRTRSESPKRSSSRVRELVDI